MAVKQENIEWIGIRVRQIHLAEDLKSLGCDLPGVRRQAMGDFQSVLIRLMFEMPADSAGDGIAEKKKHRQQQHQYGQGSPVIEPTNLPRSTPAGEHPSDHAK